MALIQAEVDLANIALGRIGAKQFTLAVQTSIEGVQANLHFAHTRDSLLRSYDWNFAIKRLALVNTWVTATVYIVGQYVWTNSLLYKCAIAHTSGTFADDLTAVRWILITDRPSTPSDYAYQYDLPSDCLRFRASDSDEYVIQKKMLFSDDQSIYIEYIYQETTPGNWDTLFYEVMVLSLALNLLVPLAGTETPVLRRELMQELAMLMSKARVVSAQETNATGNSDWRDARSATAI